CKVLSRFRLSGGWPAKLISPLLAEIGVEREGFKLSLRRHYFWSMGSLLSFASWRHFSQWWCSGTPCLQWNISVPPFFSFFQKTTNFSRGGFVFKVLCLSQLVGNLAWVEDFDAWFLCC
ncbi:MAG TPA: hypothetical protein PKG83_04285, partial [bacterium]|nr:hypothetical protein [bacterium]